MSALARLAGDRLRSSECLLINELVSKFRLEVVDDLFEAGFAADGSDQFHRGAEFIQGLDQAFGDSSGMDRRARGPGLRGSGLAGGFASPPGAWARPTRFGGGGWFCESACGISRGLEALCL
ncbi:MAG: hypothetical protein EA370_12195 [Wenzhouxiangella sp.]|nr:MAG: hypothetical protein EA370_12195 [Wenzhouxiangella sp.]